MLINDTPYQVKQITRKKVGYHRVPHNLDYTRLVDIKPIKITAEILEKNGIKNEIGLASIYDWEDESSSISYMLRYEVLTVQGKIGSSRINAVYVHQLQQALRLCGIDKRVEL